MNGKAHVYNRDHINTDEIIPARYLVTDNESELANHAMEDIDGEFVKNVASGDVIVAGSDFGCGSSREHAIWAIRGSGVSCVVAESFARIFYRNAINNGFPVVECSGISRHVSNGDELEIRLREGSILNLTTGEKFDFIPLPGFAFDIAEAGGLLESVNKKL